MGGRPLVALTPDGYEALALGIAETTRWMTQARDVILFYREMTGVSGEPRETRSGDENAKTRSQTTQEKRP